MSFIHYSLLAGLAAVAIPIIIHLLNRRTAKVIDWGAMQFLLDSVEARRKRIQLEEALLLAARCLLCGLVALCVARPFVPPGSTIPWVVIIPAFLISLVAITTAIVLRGNRKWFWLLLLTGLALLIFSGLSIFFEKMWNLKRLGTGGRKDIAIIIDASTSMQFRSEGGTNFERAVQEAREIIEKSAGGAAYTIILGGPTPMAKVPQPRVNKNELIPILDSLKPLRGKMDAFNTLAAAMFSLGQGSNPNKEIIILSDGQALGWSMDNRPRWEALKEGAKAAFKSDVQILFRKFPLPATFRNNTLAAVSLSREVVGTDREVGIDITIENTGTEAVTPASGKPAVELTIGDKTLADNSLGQLQPGGKQTVRFLHKFAKPGSYVISARVNVIDELPIDDTSETVVNVVDKLNVLIVEGNPAGSLYERAGTFMSLALAPVNLEDFIKSSTAPDPNKRDPAQRKQDVVVDPFVLPITRIGMVESFQEYDVVILADVPKLPDSTARRLSSWVQSGGGLLVTPGSKATPEFYNNWRTSVGDPLMPGKLGERVIIAPETDPLGPALNTFKHQALKSSSDPKTSDLDSAVFSTYWKVATDPDSRDGSSVAGALANGDPFLVTKKSGFGTILMACCGFENASSNLVTRQTFLPMLHQLVYYLANPEGQPLQRQPSESISIPLATSSAEGGLKAEFFKGQRFQDQPFLVRIEPQSKLQLGGGPIAEGLPADDFSVRLTGTLIPRFSEEYEFDGWGDDSVSLWINDKLMFPRGGAGKAKLEAGVSTPIKIEFLETGGNANFEIYWRSQSQKREFIPMDCLTPFPPGASDGEASVGLLATIAPDGTNRTANLVFTRSGLAARLQGDIVPGIYRMQIPKDSQKSYQRLLASDGTIPFSVADDSSESKLAELTKQDWEFFRSFFEVLEPKSAEEVRDILAGREFGEELWKYLALGALFILLAEIALTRWIALSRRSGEEQTVDFENRFQAPKEFKDQLARLKQTALN